MKEKSYTPGAGAINIVFHPLPNFKGGRKKKMFILCVLILPLVVLAELLKMSK